ncbi:hypothetical protein dsx2_2482 [Desulfovibrio sp. X2]|uniref:hypothetical protein n=1 Tax=Desulfovibrio sp. X2 TaxID=941449 RepID=UPI000358D74E|nr:hypothetical protein [Desulfovibrio sp. X2]EPR43122.1 hypothetical protein dsx2_2482 [Desulfovibrio sp. X2]
MEADPIVRLYLDAEALEAVAKLLPEEHEGIGLVLGLLGADIRKCGEAMEARETAKARL